MTEQEAETTMTITDIRIRKTYTDTRLKALVSVTIDGDLAVHDIKVIEGPERLFVAMPSRKDETAPSGISPTPSPATPAVSWRTPYWPSTPSTWRGSPPGRTGLYPGRRGESLPGKPPGNQAAPVPRRVDAAQQTAVNDFPGRGIVGGGLPFWDRYPRPGGRRGV